MAWYASVAAVSHSTSGLTTTITFRVTQRVDGSSYDALGWDAHWTSNTGASGNIRLAVNRNSTVTRDFNVSVGHNSSNGVAPNVTVTVSNLRDGYSINNVVSRSASFQPPTISVVKPPPVPTNVKLVRNSDSQVTATWTNHGSGQTAEKGNWVDGETNQSGSWINLSDKKATSYAWTGRTSNSCYRVRVGAYNDAGNAGDHGYSNYVYTTPSGPKSLSNAVVVLVNGSPELSFNIDKGNTKYPSAKVDFQYSNDNSTWRGSGGASGGVYTVNTTNAVALSAGSMDGTLKSYINNMKNGGKLYIRARVWNADNSLASGFSSSIGVAFSEQSRVYIWVPDGTNINNVRVYVNKP